MRVWLLWVGVFFSLLLIVSSQRISDYAATFVRTQCISFTHNNELVDIEKPLLGLTQPLILTKYLRISEVRLVNSGGHQLIDCEAFDFPEGLFVRVSFDGHTCVVNGTPLVSQVRRNGYVLAVNLKGKSLLSIPVTVNALVLQE